MKKITTMITLLIVLGSLFLLLGETGSGGGTDATTGTVMVLYNGYALQGASVINLSDNIMVGATNSAGMLVVEPGSYQAIYSGPVPNSSAICGGGMSNSGTVTAGQTTTLTMSC